MTENYRQAFLRHHPGVNAVAQRIRAGEQLAAGGRSASTQAISSTAEYASISNTDTSSGSSQRPTFGAVTRVVVIGRIVADKLFVDMSPVGQKVRINRVPFTVIVLLESWKQSGQRQCWPNHHADIDDAATGVNRCSAKACCLPRLTQEIRAEIALRLQIPPKTLFDLAQILWPGVLR